MSFLQTDITPDPVHPDAALRQVRQAEASTPRHQFMFELLRQQNQVSRRICPFGTKRLEPQQIDAAIESFRLAAMTSLETRNPITNL